MVKAGQTPLSLVQSDNPKKGKSGNSEKRKLRVLMIGLGGGNIPAVLNHLAADEIEVTVVEYLGELVDVVDKWFDYRPNNDARHPKLKNKV